MASWCHILELLFYFSEIFGIKNISISNMVIVTCNIQGRFPIDCEIWLINCRVSTSGYGSIWVPMWFFIVLFPTTNFREIYDDMAARYSMKNIMLGSSSISN